MMKRLFPFLLAILLIAALAMLAWGFRDVEPATDGEDKTLPARRVKPSVPATPKPALSGHLLRHNDRRGIPSGTIEVSCAGSGKSHQTTTSKNGEFLFEKLPPGECTFTATATGYRASGPNEAALATARIIEGRPFGNLEILLYPVARVAGSVIRSGNPVSGARLSLIYHEAPGATGAFAVDLDVRSDAEGQFELDSVGPGRLQVMAEHDEFGIAESQERFIQPGQRVVGLVIDLVAVGSVTGRVLRGDGTPVAGAVVQVTGLEPGRDETSTTNGEGYYRLDAVPIGDATMVARAHGFREDPQTAGGVNADAETRVDFRLITRTGFGGLVLDAAGQPVSGAAIGLRPEVMPIGSTASARIELSDETGHFWFEIDSLPFQPTFALARHPAHGLSAPARISGRERDLVLRLTGGGQVSGTFVDNRGNPLESFRVDLAPMGSLWPIDNASSNINDPTGAFVSGAVEPGRYRALLSPTDGRPVLETEPFTIHAGRTTALGTVRMRANGTITGHVVDENGLPIAGARVSAEGLAAMGRTGTVETDSTGGFRIPAVPTGGTLHVAVRGYRARLLSGISAPDGGVRDIGNIVLARSTNENELQYVGVGMRLEAGPNGGIVVQEAFPGSPADRAGLAPGTTLFRVNGYDVANMSMAKTIDMIRGEAGTEVVIEVTPPGGGAPYSIRLVRAEVTSK